MQRFFVPCLALQQRFGSGQCCGQWGTVDQRKNQRRQYAAAAFAVVVRRAADVLQVAQG